MNETKRGPGLRKTWLLKQKESARQFVTHLKRLQGDPHHIAMGMAIGVFVSITPTIPFHTVIAVAMACILRASKIAAAIGVWFSNPFTAPFFYLGSYKFGIIFLGNYSDFDAEYQSLSQLFNLGFDITCAMIVGGVVLGFVPGFITYFVTRRIVATIRLRKATADKKNRHQVDEKKR